MTAISSATLPMSQLTAAPPPKALPPKPDHAGEKGTVAAKQPTRALDIQA
jgi:hypothetical protein